MWYGNVDLCLNLRWLWVLERELARKKIREYDSKRLLKEHYKRLTGTELGIKSAQVSSISLTLILIASQICFMNPKVGPFWSRLKVVFLDYWRWLVTQCVCKTRTILEMVWFYFFSNYVNHQAVTGNSYVCIVFKTWSRSFGIKSVSQFQIVSTPNVHF